jgi:acyl carrier protein
MDAERDHRSGGLAGAPSKNRQNRVLLKRPLDPHMNNIAQSVIEIIAKETSLPPEEISLDSTLQDMNVHSLDGIQIIFEIEDRFNINIPESEAQHATGTVRQLIEGVERLVAEKTAAAGS